MPITKSRIITLPHKDLRKRSHKVGLITDEVRGLVDNMKQSLIDWENSRDHEIAVALAAVQIDKLVRVIIVRSDFDNKDDQRFDTYINPEITKAYGEIAKDYEGCLSIKDVYGMVPRRTKIKVKALDLDGSVVRVNAEGFLARIFQHEIDHMNGTVFVDHIKDDPEAFYILAKNGHLEPLDYDKDVKNSRILW